MNERSKSSRGFTLIELLAVIAIILLLLSLLAPTLQKARDRAYCVVCASNVRQVMHGIILYESDHDGYLPSPSWRVSNDEWNWLSGSNIWNSIDDIHSGLLWKYVSSEKVFRCPADPQPLPTDVTFTWIPIPRNTRLVTSYNMNGSAAGYGSFADHQYDGARRMWNTYRTAEYRQMDIMYWEGDETTDKYGSWWDGANFPWEGISARHLGAGTVASIDGHVERIAQDDFYALANPSVHNRLRNAPPAKNNGINN